MLINVKSGCWMGEIIQFPKKSVVESDKSPLKKGYSYHNNTYTKTHTCGYKYYVWDNETTENGDMKDD